MRKTLSSVTLTSFLLLASYTHGDNTLHVTYKPSHEKKYFENENFQENKQIIAQKNKAKILKTENLDQDTKALLVDGYLVLKQDTFNRRSDLIFSNFNYKQTINGLEKHAKKIDADIVLFSSKNAGESVGYFFPHGRANSNVNFKDMRNDIRVNAENFNNPALGAPQYLDEYIVNYFIKFNSITGVYPVDLTKKERDMFDNIGVKVIVVSENSPASGVLQENDIIQKINDQAVLNVKNFIETSNYLKKGATKFEILRNGQKVTKEIVVN